MQTYIRVPSIMQQVILFVFMTTYRRNNDILHIYIRQSQTYFLNYFNIYSIYNNVIQKYYTLYLSSIDTIRTLSTVEIYCLSFNATYFVTTLHEIRSQFSDRARS